MSLDQQSVGSYFRIKWQNWPLYLGLLMIILGVSFSFIWKSPSIAGNEILGKVAIAAFTEVGFAFFIAHVIIAFVDEKHKVAAYNESEKRNDELNKRLETAERLLATRGYLSHALGLDLPKSISDSISEYLVTSQLIKKEQRIRYQIEPLGKYVKFSQTLTVIYENMGKNDFPFSPTFDSYDSKKDKISTSFPDVDWGIKPSPLEYRPNSGSDWVTLDCEPIVKEGKALLREPYSLRPGGQIRMTIAEVIPKFSSDNEVFTNKQLAENLELEINYPKDKLKVSYRPIHPRQKSVSETRTGSTLMVRANCPFLPGHGLVVWWERLD